MDQIQGAGFAGQHPGITNLSKAERAEAVGITNTDQFFVGHDDQRVSSFNAPNTVDEIVAFAIDPGLGHQVQNDFTIDSGLEDGASSFEFFAQVRSIGEIAIMGDGDLAASAIDGQGLGIAQMRGAGGRVAGMADGHVAG